MNFRWAAVSGLILWAAVFGSAFALYGTGFMDIVATVLAVVLPFLFGWIYFGEIESTPKSALSLALFWVIIMFVLETVIMVAFLGQYTYYTDNPLIFLGYAMIIVFTMVAFFVKKWRSKKKPGQQQAPAESKQKEKELPEQMVKEASALYEPRIAS
jgi:hypothetical protein